MSQAMHLAAHGDKTMASQVFRHTGDWAEGVDAIVSETNEQYPGAIEAMSQEMGEVPGARARWMGDNVSRDGEGRAVLPPVSWEAET